MFSLSSNANDAWFVHWTHFHPPSCYSISLLKWIIWGFCLLLKRKVIALIRKIRGNQNLWAIIQFMQHLTHYFMVFHHISVAKQCQHLFSTQKLKAVLAPNKINKHFTQRIMKDLRYTNWHIDLQTSMGLQGQDERPPFVHWTHLTCVVNDVRGPARSNMGRGSHGVGPSNSSEDSCVREDMHKTLPASIVVSKRDILG